MNDAFSLIVEKVTPGATLLKAWPLKGGVSATMTALEVELLSGGRRKMIVRRPGEEAFGRNPDAAARTFKILELVNNVGIPAQKPLYLDPSGEISERPYLVMEYIEGEPNFSPASVPDFVRQMAAQLVEIHSITTSNTDLSFLSDLGGIENNNYDEFPAVLDESVDEKRIRTALRSVCPFPKRGVQVLVHGDYWPGNILWRNEKLVAVIDWDTAIVGSPLRDLAISRLDVIWLFGIEAMQIFTEHYTSLTNADLTDLPYWDLDASLRPAGCIDEWATAYPDLGRSDITAETMRAGHRLFIDVVFGQM